MILMVYQSPHSQACQEPQREILCESTGQSDTSSHTCIDQKSDTINSKKVGVCTTGPENHAHKAKWWFLDCSSLEVGLRNDKFSQLRDVPFCG
jgi:hypothetical protein